MCFETEVIILDGDASLSAKSRQLKELDWDKINLEMLNEIDSENIDIKNYIKSEDSKSEDEVGEYFDEKHHEPHFTRQAAGPVLDRTKFEISISSHWRKFGWWLV